MMICVSILGGLVLALTTFLPEAEAVTAESCREGSIITIPFIGNLSKSPISSNITYTVSKLPNGNGELAHIDFSKKNRICALSIEMYNKGTANHVFSILAPKPGKGMTDIITGKFIRNGTEFYDFQDVSTKSLVINYEDSPNDYKSGIKKIYLYTYQRDNQTGPLPVSRLPLLDDFENSTITNKTWHKVYPGQGFLGTLNSDGNTFYHMRPKASTFKKETHASLVESVGIFSDFNMTVDVRTDKQLRLNSTPNKWEVAWIFFHYTDTFHYYWFLLKPNGIEMGKKDCNTCTNPIDGQITLFTAPMPTIKIGEWSQWAINMTGEHIVISVDGNVVIDYTDKSQSKELTKGRFAMYNEDAEVSFDNFHVSGNR
jgi:Domain of Unknown Function (DUF1080).